MVHNRLNFCFKGGNSEIHIKMLKCKIKQKWYTMYQSGCCNERYRWYTRQAWHAGMHYTVGMQFRKIFPLATKKKILSLGSIVASVAVLSAYVAILSLQYHHDHVDTCSIVSRWIVGVQSLSFRFFINALIVFLFDVVGRKVISWRCPARTKRPLWCR